MNYEIICQICGSRHSFEGVGEFCSACGNSMIEPLIDYFESIIDRAKNTNDIKQILVMMPNYPNIELEIIRQKLIGIKQVVQEKMNSLSRSTFSGKILKEFGKLMVVLDEEIRMIKSYDSRKILDKYVEEYSALYAIRNHATDISIKNNAESKMKEIIQKINDILLIWNNITIEKEFMGMWNTKSIVSKLLI